MTDRREKKKRQVNREESKTDRRHFIYIVIDTFVSMPAPLASEKKSVYFYLQIATLMLEVNIYFPRECYSFRIVSENVFDFFKSVLETLGCLSIFQLFL